MSCGTSSGCSHDCKQGRTCPNTPRINLPLTWLLVALFLILLAIVGPSIDDNSAEHDEALALEDAIKVEQAAERFARSAQKACPENGAWRLIDERTVQCYTHRGARTIVAKVTP